MNSDNFLKQFCQKSNLNVDGKKLHEQHYAWIKQNKIAKTPTFFINGCEMPQHYGLNDLMAMVPGLAATFEKTMNEEIAE